MGNLNFYSYRLYLFILISILIYCGCKKNTEDSIPYTVYTEGEGEIGPLGGMIKLENTLSEINGASISIPEGALTGNVFIQIRQPDTSYYVHGTSENVFVEILPPGLTFLKNVDIIIPYRPGISHTSVKSYSYDPENYVIKNILMSTAFTDNKRVSLRTNHTGLFFGDDYKLYMGYNMAPIETDGAIRLACQVIVGDFNNIPTRWDYASEGMSNANSILNSDYLPGVAGHFTAYLQYGYYWPHEPISSKEMLIKITEGSANDETYTVTIYSIDNNNHYPIFTKNFVDKESLHEEWMKGVPILFIFDDYTPFPTSEYAINIKWSLNKDEEYFTDIHYINTGGKQQMWAMDQCTRDMNSNSIVDVYEEGLVGQPCPEMPFFEYHGHTYNTVQIGNKCWMKENLNYETGNSWCYDNNPDNCEIYGRLYDWQTVMNGMTASNSNPSGVQGICPPGWHVPSDKEWINLEGTVDSRIWIASSVWFEHLNRGFDAGKRLKSTYGWNDNFNGMDLFGFTGLPGGFGGPIEYRDQGEQGYWWTSSEYNEFNAEYAWSRRLYLGDEVTRSFSNKYVGYSLRCVKD